MTNEAMTDPHPMTQASEAAAEVLERIAAHNLADPATDDLSVQLAIELAEAQEQNRHLLAQVEELKAALRIFLGEDERFIVSVGGNPNAVEAMLERARAALKGGQ